MPQDLARIDPPVNSAPPAVGSVEAKFHGEQTESNLHSGSQQITHCSTSGESVAPVQTFPHFAGYNVVSVLGHGGMGVVFKAHHFELNRIVAIKTIRLDSSFRKETRERFAREARILAKLNHPAIIAIYDINGEAEPPFFTMEYVAGGTLAGRMTDYREPKKAVELVAKIARAVHYAHRLGILHRDLKPANILLDEQGQPKVGDFGLARLYESSSDLTQSGETLGTTGYMAPEQAAGKPAEFSPATDIWALGIVLYELVCETRPFVGANRQETVQKILQQEMKFPGDRTTKIDPKLKAIINRCLQKSPADRYASGEALASDLEAYLRGEPIAAPAVSPVRTFFRRNAQRMLIGAGMVVLLAIMVAIAFRLQTPDPTPSTRTDPPEILERYKADLSANKSVELIGAVGTPAFYRWVTEGHRPPAASTKRAFHLESAGLCLMELLPPGIGAVFQVSAEVLDSSSPNGEVGIYFGHSLHQTTKGTEHWFAAQSFSETPGVDATERKPQLQTIRYRPRTENAGQHFFRFKIHEGIPLKADGRKWRKIEIKVRPAKVETYWEGKLFHTVTLDQMNDLYSSVLQSSNPTVEVPPVFNPTGGVGLLVNRADASFRNVVVTLLP